ncbi:hypothetical protein NC651_007782 [Populus alba x Populus x berolinensis]|nr:hypothetical protein NC651_007782 [Populus alba x Populus x berolinensis]
MDIRDSMQCMLTDEFKNTRNGDMEPRSSTYEVHMNPTSPAVKLPCKVACGMHTQVAAFVLKKKKKKDVHLRLRHMGVCGNL